MKPSDWICSQSLFLDFLSLASSVFFISIAFPITNELIFLSVHLLNLPEGILASSGYIKSIKAAENQSNNNKGSMHLVWTPHVPMLSWALVQKGP